MGTEGLLEELDHLLDRVSVIEYTSAEETGGLNAFIEERPRALELLSEGDDLLHRVEDRFQKNDVGKSQEKIPDDSLVDIGEMISTEMAAQGLADLAFIARGDLRACQQDLRATEGKDSWRIASVLDRTLRRLRRGLISVESAICEFEGREAPVRAWGDLETSLAIRRLYGELRREVQVLESADGPAIDERLERIAGRFEELASHRIYPLLRIEDRQQIRRLHGRMRRWLKRRETEPPESGHRLWQDVVGFVALLGAVNQREELRQHDRLLVNRAYKNLFGRRGVAFLSDALLRELRTLEGLDDELDELLLRPDDHPLASWQAPLGRLRTHLMSFHQESLTPFG